MGLLCDSQIRDLCLHGDGTPMERAMIRPFEEGVKRAGVISYGASSAGFDIRLGRRFKVFDPTDIATRSGWSTIDPKLADWHCFFTDIEADSCVIPPNSFALAESLEEFEMPKDVMAIALGKSTYARCGIVPHITPLEPGWRGKLTIEVSNTTPLPARIHALEGFCQLLFFRTDKWPEKTYETKGGKYQRQTGLTLPRVDGDNNERGE
jgi:dCTP deaminase